MRKAYTVERDADASVERGREVVKLKTGDPECDVARHLSRSTMPVPRNAACGNSNVGSPLPGGNP